MKSPVSLKSDHRLKQWIALCFCLAVLLATILQHLVQNRHPGAGILTSTFISFVATCLAAAGLLPINGRLHWPRVRQTLLWISLLLMVWMANGLPFDILRLTGLIPFPADWPALATKVLALAAAVVLAHHALAYPVTIKHRHVTAWYGYAAFVLTLPYPLLRTCWALGGTWGLLRPGAAGIGFTPWLASIPWLLAAVLSLFLVAKRPWLPRRFLLAAGWCATAVVALIGPVTFQTICSNLVKGQYPDSSGMAIWVPLLIYGSWLLWALAIGLATRSFQLRSFDPAKTNLKQNKNGISTKTPKHDPA